MVTFFSLQMTRIFGRPPISSLATSTCPFRIVIRWAPGQKGIEPSHKQALGLCGEHSIVFLIPAGAVIKILSASCRKPQLDVRVATFRQVRPAKLRTAENRLELEVVCFKRPRAPPEPR